MTFVLFFLDVFFHDFNYPPTKGNKIDQIRPMRVMAKSQHLFLGVKNKNVTTSPCPQGQRFLALRTAKSPPQRSWTFFSQKPSVSSSRHATKFPIGIPIGNFEKNKKKKSSPKILFMGHLHYFFKEKFSGSQNPESRPPVTRRVHVLGGEFCCRMCSRFGIGENESPKNLEISKFFPINLKKKQKKKSQQNTLYSFDIKIWR